MDSLKASLYIHYPSGMAARGWPTGTATVEFEYKNGLISHVQIVKSTGTADLDDAILFSLPKTQTPDLGLRIKRPRHRFQVSIEIKPSMDDFAQALRYRIMQQVRYAPEFRNLASEPQDEEQVEFYYQNGKIVDARALRSSGNKEVDEEAVVEVMNSVVPPPIPQLEGKRQRFVVGFCFMRDWSACQRLSQRYNTPDHITHFPDPP